ncbi:hypothetical protein K227x_52710 [Rubripirellula lacrimiformis]|uniref:Uncharacterized protein n=1 Tax=Rubripirellula lacrimiformis TaxID=1930273 RepID=A0A517NI90_9BACT|nr:BBP7 family outer membrane beta-barrel protein [Rubripirellula lacrimiformis]QDT06850.1 hypothetical protein K227x_52710 [Rubripirellula lacrimiformis]
MDPSKSASTCLNIATVQESTSASLLLQRVSRPVQWLRPLTIGGVVAAVLLTTALPASAQVRTKRPDRDVYQSPQIDASQLESVEVEPLGATRSQASSSQSRTASRSDSSVPRDRQNVDPRDSESWQGELQPVGHNEVILTQPGTRIIESHQAINQPRVFEEPTVIYDQSYGQEMEFGGGMHGGGCDHCGSFDVGCGCESVGCGMGGCDSMGCDSGCGCGRGISNGSICFSRDQWFGGIDLMLMFRNGDRLPPLVTTGPSTDPVTAGQLNQAGTSVLAGGTTEYKDASFGLRLTLGTWLDSSQCRSLVFRGWAVAEESFSFGSDQNRHAVLTRPFFATDVTPAEQATIVAAFPGAASGSIHARGSSNVFGGDISVRQFLFGQYGGTVDLLYGYQYMRLDENLNVSSESLSLDGTFGPAGSVISVADSIDAINDFNGGQLGLSTRYREGCWSFQGLAKVGFGSLRRTAKRSGSTRRENGSDVFVEPEGLLVRSTNSGTTTDHAFGWVPELDMSLGWHRFPHFDVTLGYHIIAMTDALQVSGAIDPNLASNLSSPLVGSQTPSPALRYDTFYVQGIHFGLQYVY